MPLKVSDGMGAWIDDFKKSDAPQFKGKSAEERRDMAIAAYMSAKKGPKDEADGHFMYKDGKKVMVNTKADHDKYAAKGYTMNERITSVDVDQKKRDLKVAKIDKQIKNIKDEDVNEISSNKLGDYMTKSARSAAKPGQSARTQDKRISGQSMADKKIRKKMGYSSDAKVPAGMNEAATDLGTIHVIHHPTKGYRQKGGGYSKEINKKTKTFKSHDTAAKSDNNALHYQHYDDKKTGKDITSLHPTTNKGTRVHTVNTATGKVTKGDYLHHHQAKAAEKLGKARANSQHFATRAGKTHYDDIPKNKRFNNITQKGHYVESVNSADKKPEKYVGPDGKTRIRMVPMDREVVKQEDKAADRASLQKAMDVFKRRGGKVTKVAPGKAAGYHGKDDPGKDMRGMMDKGDTRDMPKKKFVRSMK